MSRTDPMDSQRCRCVSAIWVVVPPPRTTAALCCACARRCRCRPPIPLGRAAPSRPPAWAATGTINGRVYTFVVATLAVHPVGLACPDACAPRLARASSRLRFQGAKSLPAAPPRRPASILLRSWQCDMTTIQLGELREDQRRMIKPYYPFNCTIVSGVAGRRTVNVEPTPGTLLTVIVPPIA
jgi:hypothetical protein